MAVGIACLLLLAGFAINLPVFIAVIGAVLAYFFLAGDASPIIAAQRIIAKHHLRPRNPAILAESVANLPPIKTFNVEQKIGNWPDVQKTHFADGGLYDQITTKTK